MILGSLSIFKYSTFFATNIDRVFNQLHLPIHLQSHIPSFFLILPVGISYYTFQSMSYTIDMYKKQLKPTKNIWHFFSYLVMFPQLVAGPIVRAKDLLNQLATKRSTSDLQKWNGIKLIAFGFFQKTVLADNIADMVNKAYSISDTAQFGLWWWVINIGFAMQIYFDFSGYSLIARGIAKLMGYHFKMNFNQPYTSKSFKEFWQRWHISLLSWIRDYVYIRLGGNKKGKVKGMLFMGVTMIVSGLWHGAGWTFIIWGALHALYLAIERGFNLSRLSSKLLRRMYPFLVFTLVILPWIFSVPLPLTKRLRLLNNRLHQVILKILYTPLDNQLCFYLLEYL